MADFNLSGKERQEVLTHVIALLEEYYNHTRDLDVAPTLDKQEIYDYVSQFDFTTKVDFKQGAGVIIEGLRRYAVHTPHPRYYGLFNPRASFAGIVADLITATFNPQMAAWSHAPYAAEVEDYLIHQLGKKFGYDTSTSDGVFCTGGAEANLTAVLCAIKRIFPLSSEGGLRSLSVQPIIYCSAHAHHSVARAARITGLGTLCVHSIDTDGRHSMDIEALKRQINIDIAAGLKPMMVAATAGTTGLGSIDPLVEIGVLCRSEGIWLHVDAAYGGAVALSPTHRQILKGIEGADSITFDIHKWLSVPMAASVFITRHHEILGDTFGMTAGYMPRDSQGMAVTDPYMHSIQWSRRFIGLKLYMSLLFYGWKGYEELVDRQMELGQSFASRIQSDGWTRVNDSPLPVICFTDFRQKGDAQFCQKIVTYVLNTGQAWLSVYPLDGQDVLRVCINNYDTTMEDVDALIELLATARSEVIQLT